MKELLRKLHIGIVPCKYREGKLNANDPKERKEKYINMLETGQRAPDFSLFDSEKKKISLHEFNGHTVLLLFFPLAFTSTCTKELCFVRDDMSRYNQLGVRVMGISVDSVYTLARYKEEQRINFPLLSDFNKTVCSAYNCLYERFGYDMQGVSKRAAFVIDTQGIIRHIEILENAGELPDFNRLLSVLEKLPETQRITNH